MKFLLNVVVITIFFSCLKNASFANEMCDSELPSQIVDLIDSLPSFQTSNSGNKFSVLSDPSEIPLKELLSKSLRNFDMLVKNSCIQTSEKDIFKAQLENFYSIAFNLLNSSEDLPRKLFNKLSDLQDSISGELLSNRGGLFCNLNTLESCKDSIVEDLENVMEKITDRLLNHQ